MRASFPRPVDPPSGPPSAPPWRTLFLALALAAAVIIPFLAAGAHIESWTQEFAAGARRHTALAAWILGGLLAVDIVAPIPSSLVSTACGTALGFLPGLLVSFAGMSLSCAFGLAAGRWASPWSRRLLGAREAALLERWHARWGVWLLAAARPVPVVAEASVVFAGLARLPVRHSAPVLLLSNLGISAVYAACGAQAAVARGFIWAFLAALALPGAALLLARGVSTVRGPGNRC